MLETPIYSLEELDKLIDKEPKKAKIFTFDELNTYIDELEGKVTPIEPVAKPPPVEIPEAIRPEKVVTESTRLGEWQREELQKATPIEPEMKIPTPPTVLPEAPPKPEEIATLKGFAENLANETQNRKQQLLQQLYPDLSPEEQEKRFKDELYPATDSELAEGLKRKEPTALQRWDMIKKVEAVDKALINFKKIKQLPDQSKGWFDIFNAIKYKIATSPLEALPFLQPIVQMSNLSPVTVAARKKPEERTEEENALLVSHQMLKQMPRVSNQWQIGEAFLESLPWMAEFGITLSITKPFTTGARVALTNALTKVVPKKVVESKILGAGINSVVNGLAMTVADVPRTTARIVEFYTPSMQLKIEGDDPTTQKVVVETDRNNPTEFEALAKGIGSSAIESITEGFGEVLGASAGAVLGKLKNTVVGNFIERMQKTALVKLGRKLTENELVTLGRQAGWHGMLGEYSEEVMSDFLHSVLIYKKPYQLPFTTKEATQQAITTLGSLALTQLLFSAGAVMPSAKAERGIISKAPPVTTTPISISQITDVVNKVGTDKLINVQSTIGQVSGYVTSMTGDKIKIKTEGGVGVTLDKDQIQNIEVAEEKVVKDITPEKPEVIEKEEIKEKVIGYQRAEMGQPIELRVYRGGGEGAKYLSELSVEVQGKLGRKYTFGEGAYYALTRKKAERYGKPITTHIVKFEKPYVIEYATYKDIQSLDLDKLKQEGYDGIIVKGGKYGFYGESYAQAFKFPEEPIVKEPTEVVEKPKFEVEKKEPSKMTTEELEAEFEILNKKEQEAIAYARQRDPEGRMFITQYLSDEDFRRRNALGIEIGHREGQADLLTVAERVKAKHEARRIQREKIKEVEKKEPAVTKEPWEMTRREFFQFLKERKLAYEEYPRVKDEKLHEKHIQQALSEGKPVPPEVLKDYPDLVKEPEKPKLLKAVEEKIEPKVGEPITTTAQFTKDQMVRVVMPDKKEFVGQINRIRDENRIVVTYRDADVEVDLRTHQVYPAVKEKLAKPELLKPEEAKVMEEKPEVGVANWSVFVNGEEILRNLPENVARERAEKIPKVDPETEEPINVEVKQVIPKLRKVKAKSLAEVDDDQIEFFIKPIYHWQSINKIQLVKRELPFKPLTIDDIKPSAKLGVMEGLELGGFVDFLKKSEQYEKLKDQIPTFQQWLDKEINDKQFEEQAPELLKALRTHVNLKIQEEVGKLVTHPQWRRRAVDKSKELARMEKEGIVTHPERIALGMAIENPRVLDNAEQLVEAVNKKLSKEEPKITEKDLDIPKLAKELERLVKEFPKPIEEVQMPEPEALERKLGELFEEEAKKQVGITPNIGMRVEVLTALPQQQYAVSQQVNRLKRTFWDIVNSLRFHPKAPAELRNDIRTFIGVVDKIRHKVYNETARYLWGNLKNEYEVAQAVWLTFARNQLARARLGKGDPTVTIAEAEKTISEGLKHIKNPEVVRSADKWRKLSDLYFDNLVERGRLSAEDKIEDYAPVYVLDYTNDWHFTVGIPTRLKRPYRGYTKQAVGSKKVYKQDVEALLGHLLKVEYDNAVDDFIAEQCAKYDVVPTLSDEVRARLFGVSEAGRINQPRANRVYEIEGKKYRTYNPSSPFREGRNYLLPMNVYNTFLTFSERVGSPWLTALNYGVGIWKTMAILSRFASFNINNLLGDTFLSALQCPKPFKFMREVETAIRYLTTSSAKRVDYLKKLHDFIENQAVLDAGFIESELPRTRKAQNPVTFLLKSCRDFSNYRESIMRTAYASYLLKELEAGKGEKALGQHSWINTADMPTEKGLGKIAREVFKDYNAMSKTYRRLVRGGAFPFGTWYFGISWLIHKFAYHKPLKALLAFLGIPAMAMFWNSLGKRRELEKQLPDGVRHRIHFILGETPEGIKVWSIQLPQDALIGTKIYSIAVNEAYRVITGEKSVKKAALDTIKQWGIKEAKGILYLTTPVVRLIRGLIDHRDPFDGELLYPTDIRRLGAGRIAYYQALYFLKCSIPILSSSINNYAKYKTLPEATKKVLKDTYSVQEALGIRNYTPKLTIKLADGKELNYETVRKMDDKAQVQNGILIDMVDLYIELGLPIKEFFQHPRYEEKIKLFKVEEMADSERKSLATAIKNLIMKNPKVNLDYWELKLEKAKTREEKEEAQEMMALWRRKRFISAIQQVPIRARRLPKEE